MNISDKKNYIAFTITCEGEDYVFAIPIENADAIITSDSTAPYAVLPNVPEYILCVMIPYGGEMFTIINLLSLFGFSFRPKTAAVIVMINFLDRRIGVPAQNAYIISACPNELLDDPMTGTKILVQGSKKYFVLDIPRLYDYLYM